MIEVDLTGVDELNRKFENMVKALGKDKIEPILLAKAKQVRTRVRQSVPVGPTGNLKRATYTKILRKEDMGPAALVRVSGRKAPHKHLVEMGHGGPHPAPAHPFFGPVIDELRDKIAREIKQEVIAELERAMA